MTPQKFPAVGLRKLSHEQILYLADKIARLLLGAETTPEMLGMLLSKIGPLCNVIVKILKREEVSALTKEVRSLDELRDHAYRLLLKKIRDTEIEFEQSLVDAGARLAPVVEQYDRDIVTLSYREQTVKTHIVLSDLRKEEFQADIATLNLEPYITRVETLMQQFQETLDKRTDSDVSKEKLPVMRSVRVELEGYLRLILECVEFLYAEKHPAVSAAQFDKIRTELVNSSSISKSRETLMQKEIVAE